MFTYTKQYKTSTIMDRQQSKKKTKNKGVNIFCVYVLFMTPASPQIGSTGICRRQGRVQKSTLQKHRTSTLSTLVLCTKNSTPVYLGQHTKENCIVIVGLCTETTAHSSLRAFVKEHRVDISVFPQSCSQFHSIRLVPLCRDGDNQAQCSQLLSMRR